tara:strand:+ start:882 stop:1127 length:246 start_codon:yes stop_codon:yes gene_type:complete
MAFEMKENHGSLWKNENKSKDSQPYYTGKANSLCEHCQKSTMQDLGGWLNTTKSGTKYIGLKLTTPQDKQDSSSGDDGAPF